MTVVESHARSIRSALVACAVALLSVTAASAQIVTRNGDGTISMTGSDLPLGQVLRAIAQVSPFEKLAIDPKAEVRTVTLRLESLPIEQALTVVLQQAGVNYVLAGTVRLVVGDPAAAVAVQQGATQPSANSPEPRELADENRVELPSRSDQADVKHVEPDNAGLERALVFPSGVPASQAGYAVLPFPSQDGAPNLVVLPPRGARPSAGALPGLAVSGATQLSVPVPPELQPLIGPSPKPSPPKK